MARLRALSDRLGSRRFATAGMICSAIGFGLLMLLPANFSYLPVAALRPTRRRNRALARMIKLEDALKAPAETRTPEQRSALLDHFRKTDPEESSPSTGP